MARHRVVILAMPCAEVIEVPGILDIFYGVNHRTGRGGGADPFYDVEVVAAAETVCSWQGLRLVADRPYRSLHGPVDTLIVTGIDEARIARRDRRLTSWVARVARRLCTGTFVLAEAGPLAMARWMVLFLKRPGGQAQFSEHLAAQMSDREPIRELQAWVLSHPQAHLSVDALAHRVHMSPRHFHRIFLREVGTTPGRFVQRARVEAARRVLEESSRGVAEVAANCGFGSSETMRVAFRRSLGVSPTSYRSRFATARPSRHRASPRHIA